MDVPAQIDKSQFNLFLPFCSSHILTGLDRLYPIEMVISSGNTLTDTLRNHVYQPSGHSIAQSS